LKSIPCHGVGILSLPDGQDFAALGNELGKVKSGGCEGLGRRAGLPDHVVVTQWHGGKPVGRPVRVCAKDGLGFLAGDAKGGLSHDLRWRRSCGGVGKGFGDDLVGILVQDMADAGAAQGFYGVTVVWPNDDKVAGFGEHFGGLVFEPT
jgi:hypothetical protein